MHLSVSSVCWLPLAFLSAEHKTRLPGRRNSDSAADRSCERARDRDRTCVRWITDNSKSVRNSWRQVVACVCALAGRGHHRIDRVVIFLRQPCGSWAADNNNNKKHTPKTPLHQPIAIDDGYEFGIVVLCLSESCTEFDNVAI